MISMVISRLISWANPLGFQQIYWIFMGLIYWFKAMLTNEERKKKVGVQTNHDGDMLLEYVVDIFHTDKI